MRLHDIACCESSCGRERHARCRPLKAMLGSVYVRSSVVGRSVAVLHTSRPIVDAAHDLGLSEVDLHPARALLKHAEASSTSLRPLYDWSDGVEDGISAFTRRMYGADSVSYTHKARRDPRRSKSRVMSGHPRRKPAEWIAAESGRIVELSSFARACAILVAVSRPQSGAKCRSEASSRNGRRGGCT